MVIDEFVVELGLDPKKFTAQQKAVMDSWKKTREQGKKTADDIEDQSKRAEMFVTKLRGSIITMLAAFTAGKGLKDFVSHTTEANASVGRLSARLDSNANILGRWGGAAKTVGGTAAGVLSTFQSLVSTFQQYRITGQSSAIPYFRAMGIQLQATKNGAMDVNETLLKLAAWGEGFKDKAYVAAMFQGAGVTDPGMLNLLLEGRAATERRLNEQKKYAPTQKDVEAAQKLQTQFALLELSSTRLGITLLTQLTPAISAMANLLKSLGDWLEAHPATLDAIAFGLAAIGSAITIGLGASVIGTAYSGLAAFLGLFSASGALLGLATATEAIPALSAAFLGLGAAIEATPIGWILTGIAALGLAGYVLIDRWEWVKNRWSSLWDEMMAKTTGQKAKSILGFLATQLNPYSLGKIAWDAGKDLFSGSTGGAGASPPSRGGSPAGAADKAAWAAAVASEKKYGIPAQVTYAQWALESGHGQHMPAGSNNPFGIKATPGQPYVEAMTTEHIGGRDVRVLAKFAKYASIGAAFDAHAKLLANSPAYAGARKFAGDPAAYANALTGVYATDPSYGGKLTSMMASLGAPGMAGQQSIMNSSASSSSHREVNIGTMNVTAPSTSDAYSVVTGMHDALKGNDLVIAADSGPH